MKNFKIKCKACGGKEVSMCVTIYGNISVNCKNCSNFEII